MLAAAVLAGLAAAPALSAGLPEGPPICPQSPTPISGSYANLTVRGERFVEDGASLHVRGTLVVAAGSCLDAFTKSLVTVGRNVRVLRAGILALGCSPGALGAKPPCGFTITRDTVGGDILGRSPLSMYLTAVHVGGSVVSYGGGPGVTRTPYVNYPIKENRIGRELRVSGWHGGWLGVLRNTVHGNVVLQGNATIDPDGVEVATNTIRGNLICTGNAPAPQLGDSEGALDDVFGRVTGQCGAVARRLTGRP